MVVAFVPIPSSYSSFSSQFVFLCVLRVLCGERVILIFPIEIKAIAFDLDGTLVETLPDLHEAAMRMLAQIGRPVVPESTVRAYIGDGVDRLVKRLLTENADSEPDAALFEKAADNF